MGNHRFFICMAILTVCFQTANCAISSTDILDSSLPLAAIPVRADDATLFVDTLIPEDTTEGELDEDSALAAEEDAESIELENAGTHDTVGIGAAALNKAGGKESGVRSGLYSGISIEQDSLANELVQKIWSFEWDGVEKIGKKLQKLERKEKLPSLSSLLILSSLIVRIQNGEYSGKRAEKHCREEAEKIASIGLDLSDPSRSPDSLLATNLLIYGGIKGMLATLQINRNPIAAGIDGLNAVDKLERAVGKDSRMKDVYLGLGIFYCALAKASVVVRSALNLIGRPVSLEKGLAYLRQSAYQGRYTSAMAKLYLIQFLSPYLGDQANEKIRIFRSLESSFPENPYFLFLRIEENLCFYPEKAFDPSIRRLLRRKIASYGDDDYSIVRYSNLVKWQYKLIDPFTVTTFHPDTTLDLREFAYYPLFLSALREKYAVPQSEIASPDIRKRRAALIRKIESRVMKLLVSSPMSQSWRGFYAWHVRDALRMGN
jgi:hypothetical protein